VISQKNQAVDTWTLLQVSQVRPIFEYVGDSAPRGCIEDEGMAPRSRLTGAGFKAPQAAVVKSHGGER
jgi:hypothetical protein